MCASCCVRRSSTASWCSGGRHRFRFRHALLAEAVYATRCPASARSCTHGWRGARAAAATPGWRRTGRRQVVRSAGRLGPGGTPGGSRLRPGGGAGAPRARAQTVDAVPDAADLVQVDLAGLSFSAAEAAWNTGAAPRAVEFARRQAGRRRRPPARALPAEPRRYLHDSGRGGAALAAIERAVELAPVQPPPRARAGTRDCSKPAF